MKFLKFHGEHNRLLTITKLLIATNIIFACCFAYYGVHSINALRAKRTVVVPSHLQAAIEVSDIDADPAYIRTMAVYSTSLLYQYTPSNAEGRFKEFLINFVPSANLKLVRAQLNDRLKAIQNTKVAESIFIEDVLFEGKNTLLMKGSLTRYTLGQQIGFDTIFLEIDYRVNNGGFQIENMRIIKAQEYNSRISMHSRSARARSDAAQNELSDVQIKRQPDTDIAPGLTFDEGSTGGNGTEAADGSPNTTGGSL